MNQSLNKIINPAPFRRGARLRLKNLIFLLKSRCKRMVSSKRCGVKIIIGAAAITFLAFLPWLLIQKNNNKIEQIANKLTPTQDVSELKEASYYEQLKNGRVQCGLCPNRCILNEGQRGLCRVRQNIGGKLYSLVYNKPVTIHLDPIEKKPLFHFLPGTQAYSLATVGCNLSCQYCQNWDISQVMPEDVIPLTKKPEQIVQEAIEEGAQTIAFSYSEPTIFYEYMIDIARVAQQHNLKTVMISNGYINEEPLKNLLPYLDGIKIDLKAFKNEFYKKFTNGRLEPVLETIKTIKAAGKHLEIVYLIIPGENDSDEEITNMAKWLKENIGENIILHFSRFYPQYKMMNKPPTPIATVKHARDLALAAGLKYIYTGNIEYKEGETTYCHDGTTAIERQGYFILKNTLTKGKCADGTDIPGVWE